MPDTWEITAFILFLILYEHFFVICFVLLSFFLRLWIGIFNSPFSLYLSLSLSLFFFSFSFFLSFCLLRSCDQFGSFWRLGRGATAAVINQTCSDKIRHTEKHSAFKLDKWIIIIQSRRLEMLELPWAAAREWGGERRGREGGGMEGRREEGEEMEGRKGRKGGKEESRTLWRDLSSWTWNDY